MIAENLYSRIGNVVEEAKVVIIECNGQRYAVHEVIDAEHVVLVAGSAVTTEAPRTPNPRNITAQSITDENHER